jgi:hypothetical protein
MVDKAHLLVAMLRILVAVVEVALLDLAATVQVVEVHLRLMLVRQLLEEQVEVDNRHL